MKLYLVQHGDALPKEADPDRPLSGKGRADVGRVADFLGKDEVRVSRVLHSGKTRARQTAEALAAVVAPGMDVEAASGLDPNDPVEPFADRLARWEHDTLVVGHLPFMDRLVARLVAGSGEDGAAAFQPGGVVCLEGAQAGSWTIAWMLRPELLD